MSSFSLVKSRRDVLRGGASLLAAGAVNIPGLAAPAEAREPASPSLASSSRFVRRIVRAPDNTYFTYPHSNGFLPDGRAVLASPTTTGSGPGVEFIAFKPDTGAAESLAHVDNMRMYYSIAGNGLMLVSKNYGAAIIDLGQRNAKPREILHKKNWKVHGDNDISPDGRFALLTRTRDAAPANWRTDMIEIDTGRIKTVMAPGWPMDHAHFSPYDPSWVCLASSKGSRDLQRMWIWHAEKAPRGRNIFRQRTLAGKVFYVGHERAMFHKRSMLTVAYGISSATPRGLYEVDFDGTTRLVSESNRDAHCNISRDGEWAVVSLQGTYSASNQRPEPDWYKSGPGYAFSDVMIVAMRRRAREFLFRGINAISGQPYQVQPSISPDGKWVLLKDGRERSVLMLELDQNRLRAFLA